MMKNTLFALMLLCLTSFTAFADNGLIKVTSNYNVSTTVGNLVKALESKGVTVFSILDHAQAAKKSDLALRPTRLVLFGNPKVGTPLMQCQQTAAIDLPQKALIYEDEQGQTWFAYNNPAYLDQRHGLSECAQVLEKVSAALANFARAATQ